MRRGVRLAVAGVVVGVALAGCAPAGSPAGQTVDVRGRITQTMASAGPEGWVLETDGGVLLPVELPDARPAGSCVSIAVDDEFPDVSGEEEIVAALQEVVDGTGEPLRVAAYC